MCTINAIAQNAIAQIFLTCFPSQCLLSLTSPQVGHELSALTPERTFESLYINPILDTLHRQNPRTLFAPTPTLHGVYDTASDQTLYLFVDVKTSGPETWPVVLKALEPLRAGSYLSTYNGSAITPGPITVVGTGNTPLSAVQSAVPRDAFFDAPLPTLGTTFSNITAFDSPIASTDFAAQFGPVVNMTMNSTQLSLLRSQVETAHAKGIKVRYWDQPGFPIGTRNAIWRILVDEGVDLLNVDDLKGAAGFWENEG
jgi:hypothetical protein